MSCVVNEDSDPYGVSAVSSFYGPGALLSWVLVLFSYLLDRFFDTEDPALESDDQHSLEMNDNVGEHTSAEEQTRLLTSRDRDQATSEATRRDTPRFQLDLSLISACVYPLVAAGNLLYYTPSIRNESIEQKKMARVSAPLLILRLFHLFGYLLLLATRQTSRYRSSSRPAGQNPVAATIAFVLLLESLFFRTGILDRQYDTFDYVFQIIWIALLPIYLLYFAGRIIHRIISRGSPRQSAAFAVIAITWLLALLMETVTDAKYVSLYWLNGVAQSRDATNATCAFQYLHAAYILPIARPFNAEENLARERIGNDTATVFHFLDVIQQAPAHNNLSFLNPRGQIAEREIGLFLRLGWNPVGFMSFYTWWQPLWFMFFDVWICCTPFIVPWDLLTLNFLQTYKLEITALCISCLFCGLLPVIWPALHDILFHLLDLVLRPLGVASRPNKFIPATTVTFTDLDQIVALLLNGCIPLGYILSKIVWRNRRLIVAIWKKLYSIILREKSAIVLERAAESQMMPMPTGPDISYVSR